MSSGSAVISRLSVEVPASKFTLVASGRPQVLAGCWLETIVPCHMGPLYRTVHNANVCFPQSKS